LLKIEIASAGYDHEPGVTAFGSGE